MDYFQAILIAIIEGLTEFLPVSSTAHMIFTSSLMGIEKDGFVKMFQVSIQFGAILAVVFAYRNTFFNRQNISLYFKLALAVIPALLSGYLFDDLIESVLEKPVPIAIVLIVGGVILLFVDRLFKSGKTDQIQDLNYKQGIAVGFWQCIALMPGVSRAAASIIGGMQQKMTRSLAAEFSFFLAVPTMLAVTAYSVLLKDWQSVNGSVKGYQMIMQDQTHILLFLIGNVVAFIVALLAIKTFVAALKQYGFKPFAWYRILLGILLLFVL